MNKWFSRFIPTSAVSNKHGRVIALLAFLLAGVLLYFALRGLDWKQFFATLKNARFGLLPLVFAWGSLSYLLRAARWRILIQSESPVRLVDVFFANMAGYLGNNILPARSGELIRAAYLGGITGISVSFILATGLVERLMDLVALIVIGSYALSATGITSETLQKALTAMSVAGAIGMAIMLVAPRFVSGMERLILSLPLPGETLKPRLVDLLHQFLRGLSSMLDLRRASAFILATLLIWLMDGIATVFTGYILNIPITLSQALVLLSALGLSSALPSTPGYVGIYQFVAVLVLVPFGISNAEAVAYIVFAQIVGLLIVSGWGAYSIWRVMKKS